MNFSGTKCDECGRIKDAANHWHQIGVGVTNAGRNWLELGALLGLPNDLVETYEVHDLCGEQCFYKHIGKLLRINPAPEAE